MNLFRAFPRLLQPLNALSSPISRKLPIMASTPPPVTYNLPSKVILILCCWLHIHRSPYAILYKSLGSPFWKPLVKIDRMHRWSLLFIDKFQIGEHFFQVPLNYDQPEGRKIEVFARSVRRRETPITSLTEDELTKNSQKPWLVYLQGGPGMSCRSPQDMWVTSTLVDRGYQILYLDQRGTGLSTCITAGTLQREGGVNDQAEYMKLFRADNIVRDCETIRKQLTANYP
jgi:hypothetical protein